MDQVEDWERILEQEETEVTKQTPNIPDSIPVPDTIPDKGTKVLKVSNFPATFKTLDILNLVPSSKIKWINDTSCLAIFSCIQECKEAYLRNCMHPFIKVEPHEQIVQPIGPRPQTTDVVAKRLIAGALGMKPKKSIKDIELDEKLREERERRELERKERIERDRLLEQTWNE